MTWRHMKMVNRVRGLVLLVGVLAALALAGGADYIEQAVLQAVTAAQTLG